jgi:predicted nucleotidyltransferase component of viral defense system
MIPQAYITEWSNVVPWQNNAQVEQDLIICRALVEIFSNPFLKTKLAFRGGTALHKLFLSPQPRYSEDIDLVQVDEEPIGEVLTALRKSLSFLGKPKLEMGNMMVTLRYGFETEFQPVQKLKLKIETNCREHFTIMGWQQKEFIVENSWFSGQCFITTYTIEELLGTKLRALYQRRKGRDLFDIWKAFEDAKPNAKDIITCYKKYMAASLNKPIPSQKEYKLNLEAKKTDTEFLGDIVAIINPKLLYNADWGFNLMEENLLPLM